MSGSELVTTQDVAERFGVTVETVQAWVRRGRIPHIRPSRRIVRFNMVDVERAITREAREGEGHVHA